MSGMLWRVAKAIADAFMEDYDEAPNLYDAMAEAAIEAMREPTKAMVDAGDDFDVTVDAGGIWEAMISAALPTKS